MPDHDVAALKAVSDVLENDNWSNGSDELAKAVLDAARPHLAAAERERIARLAEQHGAVCARQHGQSLQVTTTGTVTAWDGGRLPDVVPFAALIHPEPAAQEAHPQHIVICRCTQVPELGPCPHNRPTAP